MGKAKMLDKILRRKSSFIAIVASFVVLILLFVWLAIINSPNYKLNAATPAIEQAINSRFSFLENSYTIDKIILLKNNYAAALLTLDDTTYRALLVLSDDSYQVVGIPSSNLSYQDFEDVPQSIIKSVNNLTKD